MRRAVCQRQLSFLFLSLALDCMDVVWDGRFDVGFDSAMHYLEYTL